MELASDAHGFIGTADARIEPAANVRDVACLFGIPIDILSLEETADRIAAAARFKRRLFISTVNLNFVALSQQSGGFRDSLRASDVCTADGIAVIWLCRIMGIPVPERVAGSDFVAALVRGGQERHRISLCFFGGTENAGPLAMNAVNGIASPYVDCVGSVYPGFAGIDEMSSPELLKEINSKEADFLVVSLGAQKGQAWIMRNLDRIDAPVVSHLGALINFLAGTVKRAPPALQKLGLEWAWRIYQEPHLLRRYAGDFAVLLSLTVTRLVPLRAWLTWNKFGRSTAFRFEIRHPEPLSASLKISGRIDRQAARQLTQASRDALRTCSRLTLDMAQVRGADLFGVGCLLAIAKMAAEQGKSMTIVNADANLRTGLVLSGVGDLLKQ